jgi:hypothetical protein
MSCTFGPVTLLSGVTGTGAGSTIDLGACYGTFSCVASSTSGGAGSSTAKVQGSHDGSVWFDLQAPQVAGGSVAAERLNNTGVHARYVRGNCTAHIGSGAAVTLTLIATE